MWLIRHGSTAWTGHRWCGRSDLPLDETGRREVLGLAASVAAEPSDSLTLLSSPLVRATQTADALAGALGCGYRVDPRLREIDFGAAEGLSWQELASDLPGLAAAILAGTPVIDWPAGDTGADTSRRAEEVWRMVDDPDTPTMLLVTHGGFIRALLAARGLAAPSVAPASVVRLARDPSGALARVPSHVRPRGTEDTPAP